MNYFNFLRPLLFNIDPETAHNLAIKALSMGIVPKMTNIKYKNLENHVLGIDFEGPVGLAAGFDKNALLINQIYDYGFDFAEFGTVTPKPQIGNPKPRLFRLEEDESIVNRLGFNNEGIDKYLQNLAKINHKKIVGANIGKNKDTTDPISDYLILLDKLYSKINYLTVNISSPNTPGLRDLQRDDIFRQLVSSITEKRKELEQKTNQYKPILIKIAPDINDEELEKIVEIVLEFKIDGLILTNTTISRQNELKSIYALETGGLSGKALKNTSTEILRKAHKLCDNKIVLIGVGGIMNAEDAFEKILAGASLVQIYSGMIYKGINLANDIKAGLSNLLEKNGFKNIKEAIGAGN